MRRRLPLLRVVLALSVALVATTAAGMFWLRFDRVVVAPGQLAGGSTAVRAPRTGRVASLEVRSGESVDAGRALLRLETAELQAEADRSDSRVEQFLKRSRERTEEHERLLGVLHPHEREQAAREVERARLELTRAEVEARAIAELGREGLAGRLDVEAAELARQLAVMALEEAEQTVPLLHARQRSRLSQIEVEIASLRAQIEEELTQLVELRRRLAASSIVADSGGVVIGSDLTELIGQHVDEGDELFRLAVAPAVRFEGRLTDVGRASVLVGQRAKIRLRGYPWLIHGALSGRVEQVVDRGDSEDGFPVTLSFDDADAPGALYEGMQGEGRIVVESKVSLGRLLIERLAGSK